MLADFGNAVPSLRGRTLAAQQATLALGIAIGAPLGGLATERWGPSAAFLCVTAAATITLGLYSLLPETVETAEANDAPQIALPPVLVPEANAPIASPPPGMAEANDSAPDLAEASSSASGAEFQRK